MRAFDSKINCLAIDPFGSRALLVNIFVDLALPVERISQASTDAGWHGNRTAAFASTSMMNRTRLFDEFVLDVLGEERADILAAFVFDDCHRPVGVGEQERNG